MSRPEKEIDWKIVDGLLEAGCLGTEIAAHFDMHPNTFYDRVQAKFGVRFTEYSTEKKANGEKMLRVQQFKKAIAGDNTMLLWLGKNRLSQRDRPKEDTDVEMNWSKLLKLAEQGLISQQEKPTEE